MQNRRGLLFLVLAGALALAAAFVSTQMTPTEANAEEVETTPVLVALGDMSVATSLAVNHLDTVDWPTEHLPKGFLTDPQMAAGRVLRRPMSAGEPILESALMDVGSAGGLGAVIAQDSRAVSVKVDNVIGLAGFVAPGARVDVFATLRRVDQTKAIPFSKVILQDVRVLAVDQKLEQAHGSDPELVNVVTLEVSTVQAEHLIYAAHEGRLQLAMRSPGDDEQIETQSISVADVLGVLKKKKVQTAAAGPSVQVIKGSKVETKRF